MPGSAHRWLMNAVEGLEPFIEKRPAVWEHR